MEDSRPQTILWGTLTLSMTSGLATSIYASFRKLPHPGFASLAAVFNSSVTGLSFFSCREYIVSPALIRHAPWEQYARRRRELGIDVREEEEEDQFVSSFAASKYNQLLDSGITGATVAGAFRAISRKPGVIPVMMTAGTACTLLQYGYNELNIKRLQYISSLREEEKAPSDPQPQENSHPLLNSLLSLVGITPISEELYQERMQRLQEAHLRRVAEREKKASEERSKEKKNQT